MENTTLIQLLVKSLVEKKCFHNDCRDLTKEVMNNINTIHDGKAMHYFESCLRLMTEEEFNILLKTGIVEYNIYVTDELVEKLKSFIIDLKNEVKKLTSIKGKYHD